MTDTAEPAPASWRGYITKKSVGAGIGLALVLALFSLLGLGLTRNAPVTGNSGLTRVSKPAPDFSFTTFDGQAFTLSEHIGKPVVINFWASWCPPCRDEAQVLQQAWQTHETQGVVFVGVDIQELDEADARAFLARYGVTYPNGRDLDGKITIDYGVIGLPVTFFIDREGTVARRWVGAISREQLDAWVALLISGEAGAGDTTGGNPEEFYEFTPGQ